MTKLIYSAIASLDGYINDEHGKFEWAKPDDELHRFVNDQERPIGTYLYGRRMYETMRAWETLGSDPDQPAAVRDFAQIWRAADKVVYSTTLEATSTPQTRLEHEFDPESVRRMKETAGSDMSVGGPGLAEHAIKAGLVDECHLYLHPIVVGGGTAALPGNVRIGLELLDERRFASGVVHLHYRSKPDA